MSNALRLELYPFGIDVVLIQPGYIVTNIQNTAVELAKPYMGKIKDGSYARIYEALWSSAKESRARSETTPEDCARVMLGAIEAPRPKPRYTVTRLATQVKWLKRLLSDSALDAIFRRRYKIDRAT